VEGICPVWTIGGFLVSEVKTTDSQKLLADYVRTGSEATFRELLTRPSLIPAHSSRARLASASRAVSMIAKRGRKLWRSKRK